MNLNYTNQNVLTFVLLYSNIYKVPDFALLKVFGASTSLPPLSHCSYNSLSPLGSRNKNSLYFHLILIQNKWWEHMKIIEETTYWLESLIDPSASHNFISFEAW